MLRWLESIPAGRRSGPEFQRAVSTLAHVAAARKIWLIRPGTVQGQASLVPKDVTPTDVEQMIELVHGHWTGYLERVTDEELEREFEHQSLDACRFRNRVEDVLAQLFGRSAYHRGQIAMLVKAAGDEPAFTDLIY